MKLSKKTFIYSSIISTISIIIMILYFICMFPSLYVDHIKGINYDSVSSIQEHFINGGDYTNVDVKNPITTATIKIPKEEERINIYNNNINMSIEVKDKILIDLLNDIKEYSKNNTDIKKVNYKSVMEDIKKVFRNSINIENKPIDIKLIPNSNNTIYKELNSKISIESENETIILENDITDGINFYTNYIAFTYMDEYILITVLSTITPSLLEIRPIIFQSLPVILAISILLIAIATTVFSRKITKPIEELAYNATVIKDNLNFDLNLIKKEGNDEIHQLGNLLNELYIKLNRSFKELEEKNQYLKEENKRQEIFLKSSSHQLKTPVAASLLLVDGMINEVGKYKETKLYLPKVKQEILVMKKIIEDILELKNVKLILEDIYITELVIDILQKYKILINEKGIDIKYISEEFVFRSDRRLLTIIIENIISNAINYGKNDSIIEIIFMKDKLEIINYGSSIDEEILPNIFEPFVKEQKSKNGSGLGLYIVSYYCKILNLDIKIENMNYGVKTILKNK